MIYFVRDLFFVFHPQKRPILWRIIITQLLLLEILIKLAEMPGETINQGVIRNLLMHYDKEDIEKFKWSNDPHLLEEMQEPFKVAIEYLKKRF